MGLMNVGLLPTELGREGGQREVEGGRERRGEGGQREGGQREVKGRFKLSQLMWEEAGEGGERKGGEEVEKVREEVDRGR